MLLTPLEDLEIIDQQLSADFSKICGKKILLTGATGFIGKNLLDALLWINRENNLNIKIFAISRDPESFFNAYQNFLEYPELTFYKADVCDDLNFLPISNIDLVIHAATDVVNRINSLDMVNECISGTLNILNFAKKIGCQKFLLSSSGAVYGCLPSNLNSFPESYIGGVDLASPGSSYALGKQVSEWIVQQYKNDCMEIKVARCFAFVGPYLPINRHFAIGNFIKSAIKNVNIEIKSNGLPIRTYLYTSDLSTWLLKILLNGESGEVFNVGGNRPLSIKELAHTVRKVLEKNINISVNNIAKNNLDIYIPNLEKISRELGLSPSVDIESAIVKTANWNIKYAYNQ